MDGSAWVTDVLVLPPRLWLRCVKVFPRILIVCLCGESRRDELRRTPVKAPPSTRKRMMPPTPQHISHSSTDERQWQADLEAQPCIWSICERTAIAGKENYLDKSDDVKLEIEDLELLMDPESEVYPNARKSKQNRWLEYHGRSRAAREVAKRSERHEQRRNDSKG